MTACVCGSRDLSAAYRRDCFSGERVFQCDHCGTLSLRPQPDSEVLVEYFGDEYFSEHQQAFWGRRRQLIFAQVESILPGQAETVLDVGCGYGHLVAYLESAGYDPIGVDISERAVNVGREELSVDLYHGRVEEIEHLECDAITHIDTLYYIPDPCSHLRTCREICDPDGIMVLRLRNPLSVLSGGDLPCPHLWSFTPEGVVEALARTGWNTRQIDPGAPSRHLSEPIQRLLGAVNAGVRGIIEDVGIWTHSYSVVAETG